MKEMLKLVLKMQSSHRRDKSSWSPGYHYFWTSSENLMITIPVIITTMTAILLDNSYNKTHITDIKCGDKGFLIEKPRRSSRTKILLASRNGANTKTWIINNEHRNISTIRIAQTPFFVRPDSQQNETNYVRQDFFIILSIWQKFAL